MGFDRSDFGDDFNWGVSTAAYQIEGAHEADGKGASIWDVFVGRPKKISGNHHGNIACDFYNRYLQDIQLLSTLHIPNYRFSVSWSRIMPNGTGAVNQKGIDFYNRLINHCLSLQIQPWITLYHWDLPASLQAKGGWTNRDVIGWFGDFVECCLKHFADRVKYWIVLNEPMVFTGAGYFLGVHAPGEKGLSNFLSAAHHAAICQAEGGRIIKSFDSALKAGTTFSYSHLDPLFSSERDRKAVLRADALLNRMFLEPLLGLGYPSQDLNVLRRMEKYQKQGDDRRLAFDMDFIGLQNYTREIVTHSYFIPFVGAKIIKASKRNVKFTEMNWEVYPKSIFNALIRLGKYAKIREIIVTENGAAFADKFSNGEIEDLERVDFLKTHIEQVLAARDTGVKVNGYFVWTFLDNFEWAEGYKPRFGLVHVDFDTQIRTVKASGKWYRDFLVLPEGDQLRPKSSQKVIPQSIGLQND
jgi:beta-glucosidase